MFFFFNNQKTKEKRKLRKDQNMTQNRHKVNMHNNKFKDKKIKNKK